jgi:hypothetical protein
VDGCTYARLPPDNKIEDNDSGREAPMAKRILVVEDNEDNRFILVQILRFLDTNDKGSGTTSGHGRLPSKTGSNNFIESDD